MRYRIVESEGAQTGRQVWTLLTMPDDPDHWAYGAWDPVCTRYPAAMRAYMTAEGIDPDSVPIEQEGPVRTISILRSQIAELDDDGDKIELDDGLTLRLRIVADEEPIDMQWTDDLYGRIEQANGRKTNSYGWPHRPKWCDGAGHKLSVRGFCYWWQPPADILDAVRRRSKGEDMGQHTTVEELSRLVVEIIDVGFASVGIEILDVCNLGHRHVVSSAWIGGVEPMMYREMQTFLEQMVPDLLTELAEFDITITEDPT